MSHFSFLCQLKVLGHFAKNWFGKKIPVAVNNVMCLAFIRFNTLTYIKLSFLIQYIYNTIIYERTLKTHHQVFALFLQTVYEIEKLLAGFNVQPRICMNQSFI